MKKYMVMDDYKYEWSNEVQEDEELIVDEEEIKRLAESWGKDVNELMEQVEECELRLWKVYAQCVRKPAGMGVQDVTLSEREEIDEADLYIDDYLFTTHKVSLPDELEDAGCEADAFFDEVLSRIHNAVVKALNNGEAVDCGDYMLVRSYSRPNRPNVCGVFDDVDLVGLR